MKPIQRVLSFLLALVLVVAMLPPMAVTANETALPRKTSAKEVPEITEAVSELIEEINVPSEENTLSAEDMISEDSELIPVESVIAFPVEEVEDLSDAITSEAVYAATDGKYTWPVDCSKFNISTGYYYSDGSCHYGIDFNATIGSDVYAVADGTIITAQDYGCQGSHRAKTQRCSLGTSCPAYVAKPSSYGSYANWIIIDHGNNVYSLYAHLKTGSFTVSSGQKVKQGQRIAYSGNAGNTAGTTGQHLHFELRIGGNSQKKGVNAADYLTKKNVTPANSSYADLGTNFTAPILNLPAWKPIENSYTESDKPPVRIQTENGKANQLWYFSRQSDGSYMISSCQDGKYLDVRDAGTGMGVVIQTCVASGSDAQKWYLYEKDGGYVIKSKLSGYVLDLVNNDSTSGNTLQTWEANGTGAQTWAIYRGDECKIKGPSLSVSAGDSKSKTKFTWNDVYGESRYDVKIWKGTAWNGDAYHIEWGAASGYSINLPAGTYQAYVDASNYYDCKMSNLVTFTVAEHQHSYKNSVTNATCTAQGYTTYTCTSCGYSYKGSYTNALGHKYSYKVSTSPTTSAAGKLTGACSRCSGTTTVTLPKLSTTDYNYSVVTSAGCTTNGTGRYSWKTTSYGTFYFDVTISKTGHSYKSVVTSATCTAQGYTTHICNSCGSSYKDSYTNVLGHKYSYKATKAPTTSATGTLTGTCSKCNGTATVTLPKLNTTDYNYSIVTSAGCATNGTGRYTWKTTSYGTFYFDVAISQTGHSFSYKATKAPTTSATGILTGTCSKCKGTNTVTLPKLNTTDYNYSIVTSAGCATNGTGRYTWKTTNYGTFYFDVSIVATGHSYTSSVTAPTCTSGGYTTFTCSHCKNSYTGNETPAAGHSWNDGSITASATCTQNGEKVYICTKCSETKKETVPAIGHKYGAVITEPTCTAQGYTTHTCANCKDSYIDSYTEPLGHAYGSGICSRCGEKDPSEVDPNRIIAEGVCGDNATWTLNVSGVLTVTGKGAMYDYTHTPDIPWYEYRANISSVHISEGITAVGKNCFWNCKNLTDVSIASSVTALGSYSFAYSNRLKEVVLPDGVTTINGCAFDGCSALETISIPQSVTYIGGSVFKDCVNLKEITLPDGITEIWNYTFSGCEKLTKVNIGANVTSIGVGAFSYCKSLNSINLPDTITSIGKEAFYKCSKVSDIGDLPNLEVIGQSSFEGCENLQTIVLGKNVSEIGNRAFCGCHIQEVTIPSTVQVIGTNAFNDCENLAKITVEKENKNYYSCNQGILYNKDQSVLLRVPEAFNGSYKLPDTVLTIGSGALSGCKYVTDVVLNDGLETIEDYAFLQCEGLKTITVPDTVKTLNRSAFSGCKNMESITFLGDAPSFNWKAFSELTTVVYYPETNITWSTDIMQDYGGTITWIAKCVAHQLESIPGKEASCTEDGLTEGKKCTVCHTVTVKQEVIKAKGHSETIIPGKAATCTETGLTEGKQCSVCKAVTVKQEIIKALGHKETTFKGKAATCIESGLTDGKKCSICSCVIEEQVPIPPTGHTKTIDKKVDATCVKDGKTEGSHCKICGYVMEKQEAIPKLGHKEITIEGKAATCGEDGLKDGKKCSVCGTVTVKQTTIKATGKHVYDDKYDAKCNVCGHTRQAVESVPMFRMYDPNSSEHFYTGSTEERDGLIKAGWNYEGVGFNFPKVGSPVHRLYEPLTGEHLYTMDEKEKADLLAKGWNYEGVAFNSADPEDIPQYRLHNPNASRGAYHFTSSTEERDFLISIGWELQGIGWYSCLK